MSAFKTKKLDIETLGEYLKSARQSLGLAPDQIRRLTQIPEKYIAALEDGAYDRLPADVYVKGFLKSLAAVYHVSAESLVQQFERERGVHERLAHDPLAPRAPRRVRLPAISVTPRTLTVAAVALLSALTVLYLIWQVRSVSAPPILSVTYPEGDTLVTTRNILLRGHTEVASRVFVNGQEVPVGENGEFQEVITLTTGSNILLVTAENRFGKRASVQRTVVAQPEPGQAATSTPTEITQQPISIIVSIKGERTWIKVVDDGASVQDGFVDDGAQLEFVAQRELLLSTGDAGATRVIYNGRDLGVLGKSGEALSSIRFTVQ